MARRTVVCILPILMLGTPAPRVKPAYAAEGRLSPEAAADRIRTRIVVLKTARGGAGGFATGFLASDRLAVTAAHAVDREGGVTGWLNGAPYAVSGVHPHPVEDVAVVALNTPNLLVKPAGMAQTASTLRRGELLYIVTGPSQEAGARAQPQNRRVLPARFSAFVRPRAELREGADEGARFRLRLNVSVLPGDSGSPVLDGQGNVVAVLTSRAAPVDGQSARAYAVPVDLVRSWVEQVRHDVHQDDDRFYLLRAAQPSSG